MPIHAATDHPENGLRSHDASRVILCWARVEPPDGRVGKMLSDVQPASRGQPRSPSEVVERVWRATRSKGGDRDGAANLEVVLLAVSAAGGPQIWHGAGQGYGLYFFG